MVANFVHADQQANEHFYVAVIPLNRIESAVFQMTQLDKYLPIEHGQIGFHLTVNGPPIVLIDQVRDAKREIKTLNDDLILTVSGVRAVGHESEPYSAFHEPGYYNESTQLGSNQALTLNWIRSVHLSTKVYKLNVSQAQAQTALSDGISLATPRGVTFPYSTLTTSCLNMSFTVFHEVLNTSEDGLWRETAQSMAPLAALAYLGLINFDGSSYIKTLQMRRRR